MAVIDSSMYDALSAILAEESFVLYDIEFEHENGRDFLRVYIMRKDGAKISVDDCVRANVVVGKHMDKNDPISGEYILEVASPGIIRRLRKVEHFSDVVGEKIKVSFVTAVSGFETDEVEVVLKEIVSDKIIVDDGVVISLDNISEAFTTFDF